MERCFEWFIFDYRLNSGRTIIETYCDEYHQSLSGQEAALLQNWVDSCYSLYEVTGVLPEEGLIIKDVFNPVEIKVSDVNASLSIEQGIILLMRVLQVGEEYEFSTSGLGTARQVKISAVAEAAEGPAEIIQRAEKRGAGMGRLPQRKVPCD